MTSDDPLRHVPDDAVFLAVFASFSFYVSKENARQLAAAYEDHIVRGVWMRGLEGGMYHCVFEDYGGVYLMGRELKDAEAALDERVGNGKYSS